MKTVPRSIPPLLPYSYSYSPLLPSFVGVSFVVLKLVDFLPSSFSSNSKSPIAYQRERSFSLKVRLPTDRQARPSRISEFLLLCGLLVEFFDLEREHTMPHNFLCHMKREWRKCNNLFIPQETPNIQSALLQNSGKEGKGEMTIFRDANEFTNTVAGSTGEKTCNSLTRLFFAPLNQVLTQLRRRECQCGGSRRRCPSWSGSRAAC